MMSQLKYPFAAVAGRRAEKHALLLLAVEPELKGVLISSESGSGKSTLSRAFAEIFPGNRVANPTATESGAIEIPLNVTEDRLLGGIDFARTLATGRRHVSTGLLAQADGGVLYVDDINLLNVETAAHIAHALDSRRVSLEREGLSEVHPADFTLVGSYNPVEGEPCSLLRDRVGLIVDSRAKCATDERAEIIDRNIRFQKDPIDFVESFSLETAEIRSIIEEARACLPRVRVSKARMRQMVHAAKALGVEGNRADVFAVRAARASAVLAGRDAVSEDDLVAAIEFVLAPRATKFPAAGKEAQQQAPEEEQATGQPQSQKDDESRGSDNQDAGSESNADPVEDLIIQAIDTSVPKNLLSDARPAARSSGAGKRVNASAARRGRYSRSTARQTRDARVAIDATLRAAALSQSLRQPPVELRSSSSFCGEAVRAVAPGCRVKIKPDDLRFKQFKHRSGILFIFAVDASGSMAVNRMSQAKGALTRLLAQAYLHRDKVALISFRGTRAEVMLAPTRSVELAKRIVDALPAGGGTPLSAGIVKSIELARLARAQEIPRAMLVLFTDGRANVGLSKAEISVNQELRQLGRALRSEEITSVVVDTKSRFVSTGEGQALAQMLDARYLYLPRADSAALYEKIVSTAEGHRQKTDG